uniref:RNA helicase n=1 Tax=Albugo laibachii Nc14 TaxID=890382 RepID=F0WJZ0_9STRA|nr:premRNAsplicing factor ATPdependent RNA helicase put [Albugo laibachii Nc14]|eukprot:CCA21592.1 premRNAsplicing factor ATPdependent RNA helicase put [Albugo laibachii Nc14]
MAHRKRSAEGQQCSNRADSEPTEGENTDFSQVEKIAGLPAHQHREELLKAVAHHRVVICVGETGSGKTTQIPQFLYDELSNQQDTLTGEWMIGITQPRRVATIAVAQRVSEEIKLKSGQVKRTEGKKHQSLVGYTIRFDDNTDTHTKIKFMTDGVLVRESLKDPLLSRYKVIVLDEAHERSIHTDLLFGLIKTILNKRDDLKIIITSATLDYTKFARFFGTVPDQDSPTKLESSMEAVCPVIKIPGRMYAVDIFHSKQMQIVGKHGPISTYVRSAVETALQVHNSEPPGHILVFLTGQREIEDACRQIRKFHRDQRSNDDPLHLEVFPLYGALSGNQQRQIFRPVSEESVRKIIVATNVAETSLTIDGIRYVIDSGFTKQKVYNPARQIESLVVVPISKVAAQQRAGRAGRTAPGKCFRLYSKESYDQMMSETIPEIQRTNLANTMLYLKLLGIHDVLKFHYVDPPDQDSILDALMQLNMLEAISSDGKATRIGRMMSEFPLEPKMSRCVVEAIRLNCDEEMMAIVSMLSTEQIFLNNDRRQMKRKRTEESDDSHDDFTEEREERAQKLLQEDLIDLHGDHLTFCRILRAYEREPNRRAWCERLSLHTGGLRMALSIYIQLRDIRRSMDQNPDFQNWYRDCREKHKRMSLSSRIRKSLCAGYHSQSGVQCRNHNIYKVVSSGVQEGPDGSTASSEILLAHLHPLSIYNLDSIASNAPSTCVYHQVIHTSKNFLQHIVSVDSSWIMEYTRPAPTKDQLYALCGLKAPSSERFGAPDVLTQPKIVEKAHNTQTRDDAIAKARARFLARKQS